METTDYVSIAFDVKSPMIGDSHRHKIREIRGGIASILGLSPRLIELTRPYPVQKGLRIKINAYINHTKYIDMNLENIMIASMRSGEIAKIVQNAWNLQEVPLIGNLKVTKCDSEFRQKGMVSISAYSPRDTRLSAMANGESKEALELQELDVVPEIETKLPSDDELSEESECRETEGAATIHHVYDGDGDDEVVVEQMTVGGTEEVATCS